MQHRIPRFHGRHSRRLVLRRTAICVFATIALFAFGQQQQPTQPSSNNSNAIPAHPEKPYLLPDANRVPDANDRMQMDQQQTGKTKAEAANALRRKQISDDAAKLLELATELKTAVDKTDKDTLSIEVIRKADTIERLAKGVKEKMKLTVGGS